MKAAEWIDKLKIVRGFNSDYAVAKALGLPRQTISTYRARESTFDEDVSVRVAQLLGERPEAVYLDQLAERTKSPAMRSALAGAARHQSK